MTASTVDSPATARVLDADHRGVTVGLLSLVTMFAFEAVAVSLAMPSVAHALRGESLYPIAVIGLLTASVVGMVVGGDWSDARGPSRPLLVGGLGFVIGLLVSGIAGSMTVFVVGRLVQGLGAGLALTSMYVAAGDAYPVALRPRIFSLFAAAWVLPSIVGPFVAGALVDLLGWRSVFLVVAVFSLVSTVAVQASMARHVHTRTGRLAWGRRPAYAVVAAVGALALHLAGQHTDAWAAVWLVAGVTVVAVALPPLLPRGSLRARAGLPAVVALRGLLDAAFVCVDVFVPLVLQDESGLSPTVTGLVMMVGALGWSAGSAYVGRHGRPESFGRILRTGATALVAGSLTCLALVPVEADAWAAGAVALLGYGLMGLGMGLATPLLSTLALDLAPEGRAGASGGAIQLTGALGQSVAAGLVGAVFARWIQVDVHSSYLSGFGLAVVLSAVALALAGRAV